MRHVGCPVCNACLPVKHRLDTQHGRTSADAVSLSIMMHVHNGLLGSGADQQIQGVTHQRDSGVMNLAGCIMYQLL